MRYAALLFPLVACASSAPLDGSWSGSMEVALLGDTRVFDIEITDLVRQDICDPDDLQPEDCVYIQWTGAWDVYQGQATYGGDADLSGPIDLNHCVGDDCVALDVEGGDAPVSNGHMNAGSTWADGQRILLVSNIGAGESNKMDGEANYYYATGAMTGTFELTRE